MPIPVVLKGCPNYEQAAVDAALDAVVEPLGGWAAFIAAGDTVLLKPNLIAPVPPERGATTHPMVLDTLCRRVLDLGARPVIGDAPAWSGPVQARQVTGLGAVCDRYQIEFWFFDRNEAHQQLGFTCCMKNLYGCLAGREKAVHHFSRSHSDLHFARYLAAYQDSLPVTLNLADAIIAMEGPGPRLGLPRSLGFVAASPAAAALDAVMADIIGSPETHRLMLTAAAELGLAGIREADRELLGD